MPELSTGNFMKVFRYLPALLALAMLAGTAAAGSLPQRGAQGRLVDSAGRTLYAYDPDGTSATSHCHGGCEAVWPPYLADKTSKPTGDYGISQRADGTRQWVCRGRPLYLFVGDEKPGDHDGNGVNGSWHELH